MIGILEVNLEETATANLINKNQLRAIVISLLSLAILIFIILRLFEKIINRPLSELKDQMKKVQGGNLGVKLQPKKNDDIGDLRRQVLVQVTPSELVLELVTVEPGMLQVRVIVVQGRYIADIIDHFAIRLL